MAPACAGAVHYMSDLFCCAARIANLASILKCDPGVSAAVGACTSAREDSHVRTLLV